MTLLFDASRESQSFEACKKPLPGRGVEVLGLCQERTVGCMHVLCVCDTNVIERNAQPSTDRYAGKDIGAVKPIDVGHASEFDKGETAHPDKKQQKRGERGEEFRSYARILKWSLHDGHGTHLCHSTAK